MSSDRVSELLWLLSMSGLAVGCSKGVSNTGSVPFGSGPGSGQSSDSASDTEDDDRDDDSSSSGPDSGFTTGGTDTGDPTITTDPTDVSTTSGSDTTTGVSSQGSSTGLPGESSSGFGPGESSGMSSDSSSTGNACADYGYWANECYGYTDGQDFCYYILELYGSYYGAGCAAAIEEHFACLATLDCGVMGCAAELAAAQAAC